MLIRTDVDNENYEWSHETNHKEADEDNCPGRQAIIGIILTIPIIIEIRNLE